MCDGEISELVSQQSDQALQSEPQPSAPPSPSQRKHQCDSPNSEAHQFKVKLPCLCKSEEPLIDPLQLPFWKIKDVYNWASNTEHFSRALVDCLYMEAIDGEVLLSLNEDDVRDLRYKWGYKLTFGELKKFWLAVHKLQQRAMHNECSNSTTINAALTAANPSGPVVLGISGHLTQAPFTASNMFVPLAVANAPASAACPCPNDCQSYVTECDSYMTMDKTSVSPEYFKTAISLGYSFVVTWITSFVMVIVHERVPDMKRYPPLPDIFLDNVPHIPWAFNMCEITGTLLFILWSMVLIFHKYRIILLRRFFALAGTVFLLRCVTMLITSLSVPGTHLQCNQKDFAIDDTSMDMLSALYIRMARAYKIWSGLGMSIQGVRTCGDYMFSGHTVALTLLNFFITEYTPRNLYFLHTLTWLLNMFGIFFILAAHEHYSIDVFVAFYITSRLFLYYHTLANNRALMQSDSTRTRIWFPMFSYFESSVDGIIPNEFDTPGSLIDSMFTQLLKIKDTVLITVHRFWLETPVSSKSSMQLLTSDTHAVASNYFSPRQSYASSANVNGNTAQRAYPTHSRRSSAAQPQRRDMATDGIPNANVDATVATIAAAAVAVNAQTTNIGVSAEEKKLL